MADVHEDWRRGGPGHEAWYQAGSHAEAAALAVAIADLVPAEAALPDMEVRRTGIRVGVGVSVGTDADEGDRSDGLTTSIAAAAHQRNLTADPSVLQRVGLQIDSADPARLTVFWQAAAAYMDGDTDVDTAVDTDVDATVGGHALADHLRRRPALTFARSADTSSLRNRFHLDVGLPGPNSAVVAAALAQGGRVAFSCEWYSTVADPDGNEVDLVPGGVWEGAGTLDWNTLFGAMVCYPTDSHAASAAYAATAAGLADEAGIDLMIDLRGEGVVLDSGKDQWEEIAGFVDLAAALQSAARAAGLVADNRRLRFAQIALDAVDVPTVREFWRVVLGYEQAPNLDYFDLFDPRQLNPALFFQAMDAADVERLQQPGRIRLDLQLPADQLQTRIDSAVASGGQIIEQDPAGHRHRLADPEGNELVLRAAPPSAGR